MKAGLILLIGLCSAGCEKPKDWQPSYPPEHFANWSDRMKERFPELQTVFGPSCIWRDMQSGPDTEECFRMAKPQRWTGLWRNAFEGSRFCPDRDFGKAEACSYESGGARIWLSDPSVVSKPDYKLYRVEFIGRRTLYEGHFGHVGGSDHEIVVDRWISKEPVGGPLME